jgi:hypothetical protein
VIDPDKKATNRLIIVSFPAFAGGKFIINCLSLSRHCVPQNTECARYLINKPTDYDYRLQKICAILPTRSAMHDWREKWEFGDREFYQGTVDEHLERWQANRPTPADDLINDIIDHDLCFFMTAHSGWQGVRSKIQIWPNARIVSLINYARFWNMASKLKQPTIPQHRYHLPDYAGNECQERYEMLRGPDWPDWNFFEKHNYNIDKVAKYVTIKPDICKEIKQYYQWHECNTDNLFCLDVDQNYFNKESFLITMKQLYDWLGFLDYNPVLVEQYYSKYISLHKEDHGQAL